jgi:hypothetical protein
MNTAHRSERPETPMPQNAQVLNNAEIADRLAALAQLLTMEKANPYKIRAYRRAAAICRCIEAIVSSRSASLNFRSSSASRLALSRTPPSLDAPLDGEFKLPLRVIEFALLA